MQAVAVTLSLLITLVGVALIARAAAHIVSVIRLGQPDHQRTNAKGARTLTLAKEVGAHTRMLQVSHVGAAHWFVLVGFTFLFFTLLTAYGQLFDPEFRLPIIGGWTPYEFLTELIALATLLGIALLVVVRLRNRPSVKGRSSRFYRSTMWQGYYVEWTIVIVAVAILTLRGLEGALLGEETWSPAFAFSFPLVQAFSGLSVESLEAAVLVVATIKIIVSMLWFVVVSLNTTMGVAWHRFTAWFNIFFKRHADGATSLGALQPIHVHGQELDFEDLDELGEDDALGVGKVQDFTWKNLLDFTTCTECGRCQSQCPAWNTDKPLSPKLVITALRDATHAQAPYLLAEKKPAYLAAAVPGEALKPVPVDIESFDEAVRAAHERPLIGKAEDGYNGSGGVIDPDVLWSCTTCGACVQQCPVDIEHVDHIVDMRRYQVLMETAYPTELNGLYKNLEKAGNPWGVNASKRMDWASKLDFPVKQVGVDVEDLSEVDYLFWVGCAGAFEDRAKKTTQAVAELLDTAGVSFAVLGDGETCTGDAARRSGHEFLFQQLAMQNAEVLRETKAHKVVVTCAHCFNTLHNEYSQVGVRLDVVHHTQLLNALVREGRLTPVAPTQGTVAERQVTYHDPCYLGRHNQVYAPPRELIGATGMSLTEMPRNSERSFCCGAGGARMWMEERLGTRINGNRTEEALETGATTVAVGCPFCRVMLSDGLAAAQHDGRGEAVVVADVAQLLLAAVHRGQGIADDGPKPGEDSAEEPAPVG